MNTDGKHSQSLDYFWDLPEVGLAPFPGVFLDPFFCPPEPMRFCLATKTGDSTRTSSSLVAGTASFSAAVVVDPGVPMLSPGMADEVLGSDFTPFDRAMSSSSVRSTTSPSRTSMGLPSSPRGRAAGSPAGRMMIYYILGWDEGSKGCMFKVSVVATRDPERPRINVMSTALSGGWGGVPMVKSNGNPQSNGILRRRKI
jgi:hypothetical protein